MGWGIPIGVVIGFILAEAGRHAFWAWTDYRASRKLEQAEQEFVLGPEGEAGER